MTELKRKDLNKDNSAYIKISDINFEVKTKIEFLRMMVHEIEVAEITGCDVKHSEDNGYFVFKRMFHGRYIYQRDYMLIEVNKYNIRLCDNTGKSKMLVAKNKTIEEVDQFLLEKTKKISYDSWMKVFRPDRFTLIIACMADFSIGDTYKVELVDEKK